MQKILTICGSTAAGKTDFALLLAQEFQGNLISADSRQVYKQMDIGTGKDIPNGSCFVKHTGFQIELENYDVGYYPANSTPIWLYDIASPPQPVSSAVYRQAALTAIDAIENQNKLPILVGGTGYYISSLLNPPETLSVPPNPRLRVELESLALKDLQEKLHVLNSKKWASMNDSDRANPRRLIRAIEVFKAPQVSSTTNAKPINQMIIGLTTAREEIKNRIIQRVDKRIAQGFELEVQNLLQTYPAFPTFQAGNTIGYYPWVRYLKGEITRQEAREQWIISEVQYSKRQMTWFQKYKQIIWFDIMSDNWYAQAKQAIRKWVEDGADYTQN